MRYFLITLVVNIAVSTVLNAQVPPPAPARRDPPTNVFTIGGTPKPLSAPFESKDGGFKISFPAEPKFVSMDINSAWGKSKMNLYTLDTSMASYSAIYLDFPTAIKDKFELDTRFDMMRDKQASIAKGRIMTDSELFFGEHYGRNIVIENENVTLSIRMIQVEQRMFILDVSTRGRLSAQSGVLESSNRSRIDKYFNSFAVTQIPKPILSAIELPDDFGITNNGQKFASSFLQFSLQTPSDWVLLGGDDSNYLLELGKDEIGKTRRGFAEYVTDKNAKMLGVYSKTNLDQGVSDAMFMITVSRVAFPNFLPLNTANTLKGLLVVGNKKVTKEPSTETINGVDLASVEIFDGDKKIYQRWYIANRKGIALGFGLVYAQQKDLETMLGCLKSIKLE